MNEFLAWVWCLSRIIMPGIIIWHLADHARERRYRDAEIKTQQNKAAYDEQVRIAGERIKREMMLKKSKGDK